MDREWRFFAVFWTSPKAMGSVMETALVQGLLAGRMEAVAMG